MVLTLLPQMRTENLNQTDLESGDFTVHKDSRQIKLNLETDVDIGTIDCRTPPERETTIGDLVETRPLSVGEFLISHRFLETGCLLPEQTLPSGEVRSFEERVLQNTLDTAKSCDDINTVVVELPQLSIVPLGCPPEGVATKK